MRIRMNRDALGSPDGINVYNFEAGMNYASSDAHQETGEYVSSPLPLSHELAAHFVTMGWAQDADNPVQSEPASEPEPEQEAAAESVAVASDTVAAAPVEPSHEAEDEAEVAPAAESAPAEE